jgi:hypothetical protein
MLHLNPERLTWQLSLHQEPGADRRRVSLGQSQLNDDVCTLIEPGQKDHSYPGDPTIAQKDIYVIFISFFGNSFIDLSAYIIPTKGVGHRLAFM